MIRLVTFPFVHLRVFVVIRIRPLKQKWRKPEGERHFFISNSRIAN